MAAATEIVRANGGGAPAERRHPGAEMDLRDVYYLAERVAASAFFKDVNSVDKAFTLMMIAQARGIHPMDALLQFDVIEGRPAMKAAAIQARFVAGGGRIEIVKLDAREARAVFSHPRLQPTPIERFVTFDQFAKNYALARDGTLKKNWRESPEDMLWARLVSKTCRKIDPGITTGIPSADEAEDAAALEALPAPAAPSPDRPRHVEPRVWGQPEEGPAVDDRQFHQIVREAEAEFVRRLASEGLDPGEFNAKTIYAHLVNAAVQQGLCEPPKDRRGLTVIAALADVYKRHRDWLRGALNDRLDVFLEAARTAKQEAPESPAPDPDDYGGGEVREREPGMEG